VLNDNMTDEDIISVSAVYFGYLKRSGTSAGDETVAQLATILKAHPGWKLTIVGYTDDDEFNEGKVNARYQGLGMQRAEAIREALVQQGIGADRLTVESRENNDPASTRDTEISRAQNRRVTFTLIK
jgi:outer membrane protein OmpA-like peptidoglycan-associated protein